MAFFASKSPLWRSFTQSLRGAAALEFLLTLPILLAVFAILHDIARMLLVKNSLTRAAASIADILSQDIKPADLEVTAAKEAGIGIMFMAFMFPDVTSRTMGSSEIIKVRSSGVNGGTKECYSGTLGTLNAGWNTGTPIFSPGSTHPEVVVAAAYKFKLPLLNNFLNVIKMGPTMTLSAFDKRIMRGVEPVQGGGAIIRPLYGTATKNDPLCNPPPPTPPTPPTVP